MRNRSLALAALLLAPAAAHAQPQPVVSGVVLDASTRQPIERAAVRVGTRRTGTDREGRFRLCRVAPGNAEFGASASRYQRIARPVAVPAAGTVHVEVLMERDTTPSPSSLLYRPHAVSPDARPLPLFILDGQPVFILTSGCEEPQPGIRVIDELPVGEIAEIEIFSGGDAVARYGPDAEHGVVVIRTRGAGTP